MRPVLVVEDDHATHALFVALVRRCGYEARSAFDGRAALRYLREDRPSAAILDLLLPTLNGFQVIAEVSRFAPDFLAKTIVVTAASELLYNSYDGLRRTRKIMRKPFNVEELESELCLVVEGRPSPPGGKVRVGGPMRLKIS